MPRDNMLDKYPNSQFFKDNLRHNTLNDGNRTTYTHSDKQRQFEVNEILGKYQYNDLIEYSIPFHPKYPAYKILENKSYINDLSIYPKGKTVRIEAKLHKSIVYSSFEENYSWNCSSKKLQADLGILRTLCTDIPFSGHIIVSQIDLRDKISFQHSRSECSNEHILLEKPIKIPNQKNTLFASFKETIYIEVEIIALKPAMINLQL